MFCHFKNVLSFIVFGMNLRNHKFTKAIVLKISFVSPNWACHFHKFISRISKSVSSRILVHTICLCSPHPAGREFFSMTIDALQLSLGWGRLCAGINSAPSSSVAARRARNLNLVTKNQEKN